MSELQQTRIGFIARMQKGRATSAQLQESVNGLPLLSMEYLRGFEGKSSNEKSIVPMTNDILVEDEDILILWDGSNAGEFLKAKKGVLSSTLAKICISNKLRKDYAFYALKTVEPIIKSECVGMGIPHVNSIFVKALKIFTPSIEKQSKVADFLDYEINRIDQLIRKKESFIFLIQEKKHALSNQILDGSILKLDQSGDKGWFGSLPASWPTRRGKFLFKEAHGRSETGDEELLTVSHITGVTKRSEKDVNMFMAETTEGYKLVSKGDVIVNTMWAWMGAMGVSPHDGLISPSYGVYQPLRKHFEAGYLDLILRSKAFIAEATRRSKGIHSSRLRLYPDAFLDILFPVPSLDEQKQILSEYNRATAKEDKLVELNAKSIELLKEFRASLITEAVTGQLDIESWRKRGNTDERLDNIEEAMRA
ncbi:restriction endonuclease subunit S [Legionella pneumophila]|uniref:restriction endonuclease subunit S n=1 Tax=Legionella pneumophila TaxID=446 RepID=UPI00277C30CD|nr:restriction endonuclease subunit S [Legionella pneumophila]